LLIIDCGFWLFIVVFVGFITTGRPMAFIAVQCSAVQSASYDRSSSISHHHRGGGALCEQIEQIESKKFVTFDWVI
jgi:hypothetical protein